jgi:hypothetical protein
MTLLMDAKKSGINCLNTQTYLKLMNSFKTIRIKTPVIPENSIKKIKSNF